MGIDHKSFTKGMQMGGTRADLGEPNTKPDWRAWMQFTGIVSA